MTPAFRSTRYSWQNSTLSSGIASAGSCCAARRQDSNLCILESEFTKTRSPGQDSNLPHLELQVLEPLIASAQPGGATRKWPRPPHTESEHLFGRELRIKFRIEMASWRCRQDIARAALHLVIDDYNLASSRHDLHGRMRYQLGDSGLPRLRVAKAAQPTSSTAVSGQVRFRSGSI